MGCFDSVQVPCPKCQTKVGFQSKSGDCTLRVYQLETAPDEVLKDVNRHSPHTCTKCGAKFKVVLAGPLEVDYPVLVEP